MRTLSHLPTHFLDKDLKTVGKRIHNKDDMVRLQLLTKEEWKELKRTVVETAKAGIIYMSTTRKLHHTHFT